LILLTAALAAALSWLYYADARRKVERGVFAQLAAVAELKAQDVTEWHDDRERECGAAAEGAARADWALRLARGRGGPEDRRTAEGWLAGLRRNRADFGFALIDGGGKVAALSGVSPEDVADLERDAPGILAAGMPHVSDLHRPASGTGLSIHFLAPFGRTSGGRAEGAVALVADPQAALFARLRAWPLPGATPETLLVRRDGDSVLFLNDLRHTPNAALRLRIPLDKTEIPAVKAVFGRKGSFAGVDYRGAPVLAAVCPVPGGKSAIVAKIDRWEAQEPLLRETKLFALLAVAMGAAILLGVLSVNRRRAAGHYRELYAAESERRLLADTVAASLNEIYLFDSGTYRFRFVNDGALRNLGYSAAEIAELTPLDLKPDFTRESFETLIGPLKKSEKAIQMFETVHRRKDGSLYPVEVRLQLVERGDEKVFLAVILDIGEKRQLEERLRDAQRLESIGRLAGGVTHDFNNYLTVINGYADLLLPTFEPHDPRHNRLTMIRQAGEKAGDLTRQLLAFSRRQILEVVPVDVNSAIVELRPLLRRLVREDVELAEVLADDLGLVPADPAQVSQVVMNLVLNARDAIPAAGRILIETANVEMDERKAGLRPGVPAGPYVMLAVTDTGLGMTEEVMSRVFEPFFTTKEQGHGTGLGLAAVHGIVRQMGGWIWVYSEPGKGSTFKVYLPRTARTNGPRPAPAPSSTLTGAETVLVVEDLEEVRGVTSAVLRAFGYRVLAASGADEAVSTAREYEGAIHLLVTDVVMPGKNGRQLAEELRASRPEMKTLFVSGYTSNVVAHHGVLDRDVPYLAKPFTPQALGEKVRSLLDATP
jgi:PAS domain S-box-containing protein